MNEARLKELLSEVRSDISGLQRNLEELRQVETYLISKLNRYAGLLGVDESSPPRPAANLPSRMTQSQAAERVLKEAKKPMDTQEIVRIMIERRYYPDKGDRKQMVNSVFSAMRRSPDRFTKVGKGLWSLVEREDEK